MGTSNVPSEGLFKTDGRRVYDADEFLQAGIQFLALGLAPMVG